MTEPYFLSRITLRTNAEFEAIASLLAPRDMAQAARSGHHLIWSLFAGDRDAKRDFLWHRQARNTYLVLSRREPVADHALFKVETSPFKPHIEENTQLSFMLRANPTVTIKNNEGKRIHHDVVMHALDKLQKTDDANSRAEAREQALTAQGAAGEWLMRKATKAGFKVIPEELAVLAYEQVRLPVVKGSRAIRFSTLDYQGILTVTDPPVFLRELHGGFGRAKSYGCGLMLLKRMMG